MFEQAFSLNVGYVNTSIQVVSLVSFVTRMVWTTFPPRAQQTNTRPQKNLVLFENIVDTLALLNIYLLSKLCLTPGYNVQVQLPQAHRENVVLTTSRLASFIFATIRCASIFPTLLVYANTSLEVLRSTSSPRVVGEWPSNSDYMHRVRLLLVGHAWCVPMVSFKDSWRMCVSTEFSDLWGYARVHFHSLQRDTIGRNGRHTFFSVLWSNLKLYCVVMLICCKSNRDKCDYVIL